MRSVPEWVARNHDQVVPGRVQLRVWNRCGGQCGECSRKIGAGEDWDIDHERPLALGGEHREANLRIVHVWCHRSKTRMEQARKAKADRVAKKHHGMRKRRSFRAWRNFKGEVVYADD
jgi:5-methylcytosine-specific restriction endonuclease McrA